MFDVFISSKVIKCEQLNGANAILPHFFGEN